MAFEAAGKAAFEAAAVRDPSHAAELRATDAKLVARVGCH
jgi:hypothetical protein